MKLSKALIKKYGISKKAWAIQRGKSNVKRSSGKRKSKNKRRVSTMAKKSNSTFGISNNDIWKGVGAGAAGTFGGLANQIFPQISGDIAQGIVGLGFSIYGKGKIKQIGKGAVIKTIGDFMEAQVVPMIMGKVSNNQEEFI